MPLTKIIRELSLNFVYSLIDSCYVIYGYVEQDSCTFNERVGTWGKTIDLPQSNWITLANECFSSQTGLEPTSVMIQ